MYLILMFTLITALNAADDVEIVMNYNQNVTLQCNGTNVEWYKIGMDGSVEKLSTDNKNYVITTNSLTINRLLKADVTVDYLCNSSDVSQKFISKPGPYMFDTAVQSKTVSEGGAYTFTCKLIVGFQQNQTVLWKWVFNNDELVNTSDSRITSNASESSIRLGNIKMSGKGGYMCVATNQYGNASATQQLRVKNTLAALWPFLVICVEVLVLCVIIFLCEKKCMKKPEDDIQEQKESLMKEKQNSDAKKRSPKA